MNGFVSHFGGVFGSWVRRFLGEPKLFYWNQWSTKVKIIKSSPILYTKLLLKLPEMFSYHISGTMLNILIYTLVSVSRISNVLLSIKKILVGWVIVHNMTRCAKQNIWIQILNGQKSN